MTIKNAIKNRLVAKSAAFGISAENLSQIRGGVLLDIQDCTHVSRTNIQASRAKYPSIQASSTQVSSIK